MISLSEVSSPSSSSSFVRLRLPPRPPRVPPLVVPLALLPLGLPVDRPRVAEPDPGVESAMMESSATGKLVRPPRPLPLPLCVCAPRTDGVAESKPGCAGSPRGAPETVNPGLAVAFFAMAMMSSPSCGGLAVCGPEPLEWNASLVEGAGAIFGFGGVSPVIVAGTGGGAGAAAPPPSGDGNDPCASERSIFCYGLSSLIIDRINGIALELILH